jgi:hypothetical protein
MSDCRTWSHPGAQVQTVPASSAVWLASTPRMICARSHARMSLEIGARLSPRSPQRSSGGKALGPVLITTVIWIRKQGAKHWKQLGERRMRGV